MIIDLQKNNILVTGASRGIGAAIAKELALNKMTEPTDISPIVTLLASGLADHASGTTIDINAASYVH